MLNTRNDRKTYGILFRLSLFCENSNIEYASIYVIYRVNQAEYGIRNTVFIFLWLRPRNT